MKQDVFFQGAAQIAGTLAVKDPNDETVIQRSIKLAAGLMKNMPQTPEPSARAAEVEQPEDQTELFEPSESTEPKTPKQHIPTASANDDDSEGNDYLEQAFYG